jgi:sugar/nucleoside kinase (ribokinase family)
MTKQYDVLAIGVAAVDDLLYVSSYPPSNVKVSVTARERHGGGPACTAIAAVGTLAGRSAYCARLGEDDLSLYIEHRLQQCHVDTTHIIRDSEAAPYHSSIVVDLHGNRNVFYDASMFKPVTCDSLADSLILSAELILLDHVAEPALTEIAKKIRTLGVPILGDIEGHSESALRLAGLVDHLVVPLDFARWASNSVGPADTCVYLAQTSRTTTVVTAGSDGCYYTSGTDSSITHFPAFKVETFDTNGCGDTFHGAFALAMARNFPLNQAITFASAAAAVKASGGTRRRRGWNALPTLDDVILLLRSHSDNRACSDLLERIAKVGASTLGSERGRSLV